jgi:hypothetical protein
MNNDAAPTVQYPFQAFLAEITRPVPHDGDPVRRRLLLARQIVFVAGAALTLIQVVVWLLVAVLGGGLDVPWWLWTAVPAAAAVAALTGLARFRATRT